MAIHNTSDYDVTVIDITSAITQAHRVISRRYNITWIVASSSQYSTPLPDLYSRRGDQNTTRLHFFESRDLHWLRVPERIKFRLCVLTHRCLHGTAPPYLAETLQLTSGMSSRRHLRSAATPTLVVPSTRRSTVGDRAFPVAAARAWNTLPSSLRVIQSLTSFRRCLKTELFDGSFI